MNNYIVYIISNKFHGSLYIGVTNDLRRRIIEHKLCAIEGFSQKYGLKNLVHFEQFEYIDEAIGREKQLKRWHRDWKINLIEKSNPEWKDIFSNLFDPIDKEYEDWILKRVPTSPRLRRTCQDDKTRILGNNTNIQIHKIKNLNNNTGTPNANTPINSANKPMTPCHPELDRVHRSLARRLDSGSSHNCVLSCHPDKSVEALAKSELVSGSSPFSKNSVPHRLLNKIKIPIFTLLLSFSTTNYGKTFNDLNEIKAQDPDMYKLIDSLFDFEEINSKSPEYAQKIVPKNITDKVAEKSTQSFDEFLNHFNKYYPKVFLIREKFLTNMTPQDIANTFEKIINTIAYKPHYYIEQLFTAIYKKLNLTEKVAWQNCQYNIEFLETKFKQIDIKKLLINNNNFESFIADQLAFFHEFLKYSKVDPKTKIVYYERGSRISIEKNRIKNAKHDAKIDPEPLTAYWTKNNIKIHYDFYELCFDYWSRLFLKAICDENLKQANRFHTDLKKIVAILKNDPLINEYLNKYNELLSLLKKSHYSKKLENLIHDKDFSDILAYHGITT